MKVTTYAPPFRAPFFRSLKNLYSFDPYILAPGGGGYSLCDGWYIFAAVLTPFFHFGRIEHDLFGYFFSSTNTKTIFCGIKTTNSYRIRSFRPQISFFPRSFWFQFSAASGTPPSFFGPSTPPGILAKMRKMSYFDPYFSSKLGKMYSFDPPFLPS